MSKDCIEVKRISEVLELPADDSTRRHVEACPRCSAILASYQGFLNEEITAGSDPDEADARLTAFLASEIGVLREEVRDAAGTKDHAWKDFLPRIMKTFYLRPAWVAALLVIIAAGVYGVLWWHPWTPDKTVLRGPSQAEVSQPLTLSTPQRISGEGVRLEWTPMAGADAYQVRFYDRNLNEIVRLEPTNETALIVGRSMFPAQLPAKLIWRVVALEQGDEIGSSDAASLEFP
ncbi:MAG: hypothetical protein JSV33_03130 [bacterium]|nr:MAG: hypothetical protein JSV33_03130 [bacterium]